MKLIDNLGKEIELVEATQPDGFTTVFVGGDEGQNYWLEVTVRLPASDLQELVAVIRDQGSSL